MRTRTIPAVFGTAALLALAGCADDTDTATTTTTAPAATTETTETTGTSASGDQVLQRIADAAERTVDEGTANMTITVGARDLSATGGGGSSQTTSTAADPSDDDHQFSADGAVDFDQELRRLTLAGPQGSMDVIVDGQEVYVEVPGTEDDTWFRIDLDELFDRDLGFGGPGGLPFQDPASNLRLLEQASSEATELGQETVRGEQTDRFQVTVDLHSLADEASDEARRAAEQLTGTTGLDELELHLWVGEDDLIHRIAYSIDAGQADLDTGDTSMDMADPEGRVTLTVDYFDFGTTVDIGVPTGDQVIDLDEDALRDAFGGGAGGGTRSTTSTTRGTGGATTTEVAPTTTTGS